MSNGYGSSQSRREYKRKWMATKYRTDPEYREHRRQYNRERYATDTEYRKRCLQHVRKYRLKHREQILEYLSEYYKTHREQAKEYNRNRYATDPEYREKAKARARANYYKMRLAAKDVCNVKICYLTYYTLTDDLHAPDYVYNCNSPESLQRFAEEIYELLIFLEKISKFDDWQSNPLYHSAIAGDFKEINSLIEESGYVIVTQEIR